MSIDIDAICNHKPNLETAQRLALWTLKGSPALGYVGMLFAFEPNDEQHEWDGKFPVLVTSPAREPEAYVATFVYASSIAVLYDGFLRQDVDFFPDLLATDVIETCVRHSGQTPEELWALLLEQSDIRS